MSKILIIFATCLLLYSCGGSGKRDKEDTRTNDIQSETDAQTDYMQSETDAQTDYMQSETQHDKPVAQKPQLHAKIIYDRTSNGTRTIETNYIRCIDSDTNDGKIKVSLRLLKNSDDKLFWSLLINIAVVGERCHLPKSGRMLIRLDDEDVIELTQSLESKDTHKDTTFFVSIDCNEEFVRRYYRLMNLPTHASLFGSSLYGQYQITEDMIRNIVSHTVTKVRVEKNATTEDYAYIDFDTDYIKRFSDAVATEYEMVLEALDTKKDFYSDF